MKFFSSSAGITQNPQLPVFLNQQKIRPRFMWQLMGRFRTLADTVFIGWGYKANTLKTRQLAQ